nr:immunoglobulin heavy chain junction region [Macaca mulatta]
CTSAVSGKWLFWYFFMW